MKQKQITVALASILCITTMFSHAQTSKVVIDNDKVKVTEYVSQPGEEVCGKGKHAHADHVTILLTDADVKTTEEDGTVVTGKYTANKHAYEATKKGKTEKMDSDGTFWVKGVAHSVTNTGSKPLRFYIIETK